MTIITSTTTSTTTTHFLLGASDPEMEAIEGLLKQAQGGTQEGSLQIHIHHATAGGSRVHPGNAAKAEGAEPPLPEGAVVVTVECSLQGVTPLWAVDHHNPGDPGFGQDPEAFWSASSIGQLCQLLGIAPQVIDKGLLLVAAADHCLGAAYAGQCPGVDPLDLAEWRVQSRAKFQGVNPLELREKIWETTQALKAASYVHVAGLSFRDMRREAPFPELPEAATRLGVSYISGPLKGPRDDREKYTVSGSAAHVAAWMSEAPKQGLVEVYGDPKRGFAGGYKGEKNGPCPFGCCSRDVERMDPHPRKGVREYCHRCKREWEIAL